MGVGSRPANYKYTPAVRNARSAYGTDGRWEPSGQLQVHAGGPQRAARFGSSPAAATAATTTATGPASHGGPASASRRHHRSRTTHRVHVGRRSAAGAEADVGRAPFPAHPANPRGFGRENHRHVARDRQLGAASHVGESAGAQG